MERIASFRVNHLKLKKGLYVSRIDGDAITYDLRMAIPNSGAYLENAGIHTFEHLAATYLRNTDYSDRVIYVGPMGCRTGFYLIFRDSITKTEVITLLQETMRFVADFTGEVPGVSEIECGNYREHDLTLARAYAADMQKVLEHWTPEQMQYEE